MTTKHITNCMYCPAGKWTIPVRTGDYFPPYNSFSLNPLPGNKAILFGGVAVDIWGQRSYSQNVFIISFANKCVVSYFLYLKL